MIWYYPLILNSVIGKEIWQNITNQCHVSGKAWQQEREKDISFENDVGKQQEHHDKKRLRLHYTLNKQFSGKVFTYGSGEYSFWIWLIYPEISWVIKIRQMHKILATILNNCPVEAMVIFCLSFKLVLLMKCEVRSTPNISIHRKQW